MTKRPSIRQALGLGLALLAAAAGCDGLGSDKEKQQQAEQLAACRGDTTDAELQENILISEEYGRAMAADLYYSWHPVLFALDFTLLWAQTLGAIPSTEPVGWTFDGETGTYRYGSDTAAIEMQVFLTEEIGYGPAGTQVMEDILDVDSYLVNAAFELDGDAVTVTFDEPGPLVELLGQGANPESPLVLDQAAQDAAVDQLSTLALETDYVAYGVNMSITVDYHAVSPPTTIASLVEDGPMPVDIVEANATRDLDDQRLSTVVWDVERRGTGVDGYTTFTVSGGYFPFGGRVDFYDVVGVVYAERELYCL